MEEEQGEGGHQGVFVEVDYGDDDQGENDDEDDDHGENDDEGEDDDEDDGVNDYGNDDEGANDEEEEEEQEDELPEELKEDGGSGEVPKEDERSKVCVVCTFLNFESAKRCTMCRTAFGAVAEGNSSSATKVCAHCTSFNDPAASFCVICNSFAFLGQEDDAADAGVDETGKTTCARCSFINDLGARECSMCSSPFEPAQPMETEAAGNVSSILTEACAAQSSSFSFNNAVASCCVICYSSAFERQAATPEIGREACPRCSSINDRGAKCCVVCNNPFSEQSSGKACSKCTFINNESDQVCSVCASPLGGELPDLNVCIELPAAEASAAASHSEFQSAVEGFYGLETCGHSFCRACIVKHVGELLSNKEERPLTRGLSCPVEGCVHVLSRQDIRVVAGIAILQELDDWILGKMVENFKSELKPANEIWDGLLNTVQTLKAVFEARMDVKFKKRKGNPRDGYEDMLDSSNPPTKKPSKKKRTSTSTNTVDDRDSALSEVLRKLADDIRRFGDGALPYPVTVFLCSGSAVWNVLGWLLRNDSTMDIVEHGELYFQAFGVFRALSSRPELFSLLVTTSPGHDFWNEKQLQQGSLLGLFDKLYKQSLIFLGSQQIQAAANFHDDNSAVEAALLAESKYVYEELRDRVAVWKMRLATFSWLNDADEFFRREFPRLIVEEAGTTAKPLPEEEVDEKGKKPLFRKEEEQEYVSALKSVQFAQAPLLQNHYFRDQIEWGVECNPSRTRRIMKEIAGFATNLPLEWNSSIHIRVDDCRTDLLKALIVGPEGTPYQDGIFLFDIFIGRGYPGSPPEVKFLTTGGGRVRFNPNLYNCGKVCLSLLNTWTGPRWSAGDSTLLQVLVSLQSLVFVSDPFYNEPGYASPQGGDRYKKQAEEYKCEQMFNTLVDSILPALRQPEAVFQEVIDLHFKIKRRVIEEQCDEWAKVKLPERLTTRSGDASRSPGSMVEAAMEVKKELAARFD